MIVGICGYGYTGSGAVEDLLQEYDEITVPDKLDTVEFTLAYEPDGLCDLRYHLVENRIKHFAPDFAIYRFIRRTKWKQLAMDRRTGGQFSVLTDRYLKAIVQATYHSHRITCGSLVASFWEKSLTVIQRKLEFFLHRYIPLHWEQQRYIAAEPTAFYLKTREYVMDIIRSAGVEPNTQKVLLDQPFPPHNPGVAFDFYDDPRAIVVSRDPRDLYLIAKYFAFSEARFIPTGDYRVFCAYYRSVMSCSTPSSPDRVLRIRFEDLIYRTDDTVRRIEAFLRLTQHTRPRSHFQPEQSIRNTNLKEMFPQEQEAIACIERELAEYCYPFPEQSGSDDAQEKDLKTIFDLANRQDYLPIGGKR